MDVFDGEQRRISKVFEDVLDDFWKDFDGFDSFEAEIIDFTIAFEGFRRFLMCFAAEKNDLTVGRQRSTMFDSVRQRPLHR